jgi:type IX secretion system PorP/SprF family membrane protein
MKKIVVLAHLLGLFMSAYGQQYPYFSQYFLNPYLYNPAALGNSGYNEVNLTYRQQWLGINDAPTTQAFNVQLPTRKSLSFGINFYNDKAVLLNTSSLALGVAYQANISEGHFLKFGLSTGVGFNNFDLSGVDNPNDPALNDVLSQTSFLTGQFGVYYYVKGLKLGFSLPQLYKYNAIDTTDFQKVTIDQLDNYILTASYKFNLGTSKVGLEPFGMYRKSEMLPSIMEAGVMMDYNDLFWIGGSYRKDYGGTGYMGVNIKKNISFAYAYEFAGGQQVSLGNGSHEFNFKIRFGKNKHEKVPRMLAEAPPASTNTYSEPKASPVVPVVAAPVVIPPVTEQPEEVIVRHTIEESLKTTGPAIPDEPTNIKAIQPEVIIKVEDPNLNKPKPTFKSGYYVVLGAFEVYDNAIMYSKVLNNKGIKVDYGYVEDRGLYYVFNIHTTNFEEATRMQNQFRQLKDFQDAWVFGVQ